ncbi:MAG: 16S rRNA (uracil(1498)-N(3))-methyltransferase [Gammaproteobacteria bacterium]|nr:16S rRNA (uracil(1498)-N(3))-methyltransferase [Gammaproteobacteria bacterium]
MITPLQSLRITRGLYRIGVRLCPGAREPELRHHRVYLQKPIAGQSEIVLEGETAHYLLRVLRLRTGAKFTVFDGTGGEYVATMLSAAKDRIAIRLEQFKDIETESDLQLVLGQGVARGERMDQVLQKATELGVAVIAPLTTDHTVVRLNAKRAASRHEHWQKIIISACEQCGRNRLPQLLPLQSIDEFLTDLPDATVRLMLQPGVSDTLASLSRPDPAKTVVLLIGPEGGLGDREQEVAQLQNFVPVSLGPRVLRTETATLASIAILQSLWGDIA